MRGAEIRGVIAVVVVIIAIAASWTAIENRNTDAADVGPETTTTTTTTTLPAPTSTSTEQAVGAICGRSEDLLLEIFVAGDAREATVAQLTLEYWTDMLDLVSPTIRIEVVSVVDYYTRYLEVGEPFGFDTDLIIVDGDKERWEQLVTRPAGGLAEARSLVSYACGVELPEQFRIDGDDFEDLEDELLDDD